TVRIHGCRPEAGDGFWRHRCLSPAELDVRFNLADLRIRSLRFTGSGGQPRCLAVVCPATTHTVAAGRNIGLVPRAEGTAGTASAIGAGCRAYRSVDRGHRAIKLRRVDRPAPGPGTGPANRGPANAGRGPGRRAPALAGRLSGPGSGVSQSATRRAAGSPGRRFVLPLGVEPSWSCLRKRRSGWRIITNCWPATALMAMRY